MKLEKNTKLGKYNKFYQITLFILFIFISPVNSKEILEGSYLEVKIFDKISSKTSTIDLKIGEETEFKNLLIKSLKCKNSEFDDNPDITAYLQVKDLNTKDNDKVFIFNGWTFASSPSLKPFDHPVYDIWITKCFN